MMPTPPIADKKVDERAKPAFPPDWSKRSYLVRNKKITDRGEIEQTDRRRGGSLPISIFTIETYFLNSDYRFEIEK